MIYSFLQVLCSAGVNLDEDLDEANPRCQPAAASESSKLLEINTEKDGNFPQIQPVPCFTEPVDCRRNIYTEAGMPDATTEITPSHAEQTCTVPGDFTTLADLTTAIGGAEPEEDQENCKVIHQANCCAPGMCEDFQNLNLKLKILCRDSWRPWTSELWLLIPVRHSVSASLLAISFEGVLFTRDLIDCYSSNICICNSINSSSKKWIK